MASRNTLPEITGGTSLLRDAMGDSKGPISNEAAPDAVYSVQQGNQDGPPSNSSSRRDFEQEARSKVKVPFNLPCDLAERIRDAVYALSGPPYCLSLAAFAEQALRTELARLEREANKGRQFMARAGRLRPGRRLGSAS